VDQSLQRQNQWVKQRAPPFENAFKVRTDRFDEKRHDNDKEASLNGICVHVKFVTANIAATGERAASAPPMVPQPKRFWLL
jgi:recombination DNA repair RAD52 pathway protein